MIKFFLYKIQNRIRREINQLHRYDYSPENNGWKKKANCPVLGDKVIGTLYDPYVLAVENTIYLYVSSRKNHSIVRFQTEDGKNWSVPKEVLNGIDNTWQRTVNRACILHKDSVYHMWYCGMNENVTKIGYATSKDGLHFARLSSEPVLTSTEQFEGVSVMNPSVLWDDSRQIFRMWYAAGDNYEPDVICYAESFDGIHWNKHNSPVLKAEQKNEWEKMKVGGCHVIGLPNGKLQMYYIGYQNLDVARVCFANSEDGINWTRPHNNLVISPTKGSWDSDATYKPTVLIKDNLMYLWYNGRKKNDEYIGFAIKEKL